MVVLSCGAKSGKTPQCLEKAGPTHQFIRTHKALLVSQVATDLAEGELVGRAALWALCGRRVPRLRHWTRSICQHLALSLSLSLSLYVLPLPRATAVPKSKFDGRNVLQDRLRKSAGVIPTSGSGWDASGHDSTRQVASPFRCKLVTPCHATKLQRRTLSCARGSPGAFFFPPESEPSDPKP